MNIQSILSHKTQLIAEIKCYNPAFILLSESRTTKEIEDFELEIKNYSTVRCNSNSRHTGGVLLYIRDNIKYAVHKVYVIDGNYWCKVIKVTYCGSNWLIGCIYHSPSASHSVFLENFEHMCEDLFCCEMRSILIGDFNINYSCDEFYSLKIKRLLGTYGITQNVKSNTRSTITSSTLIDYVLTNFENVVTTIHDEPIITDHSTISVNFSNIANNNVGIDIKKCFRNFSETNLFNININLIDCNFLLQSTDVNLLYNNLESNCEHVVNKIAPISTVNCRTNDLPWYDNEIRNKTKERNRAYKIFKINSSQDKWQNYKKLRNEVVNMIKEKEQQFYHNEIDRHKNNPHLMWKTLKKLINPKNFNIDFNMGIQFEVNDQITLVRNQLDIAEYFNKYFINSITEIVDSIDSHEYEHSNNNYTDSHFATFKLINLQELAKKVKELDNKGSTNVVLSSVLIKSSFEVIGHVWLHFINTSLDSGKFPKNLKTSTIIPIEKINNTNKSWEFRPINTLPSSEKLLEMIVYQQLIDYFNNNNLFFINQSGFRANHSCESALQLTITEWKQKLDEGNYTVAVFLDLKRAFETIDRSILIKKLFMYGIQGKVLNWLKDYLANREQITKIGEHVSSPIINNYGIPQGSILGPLLFLIYINDINEVHNCDFLNLFADDTLLSVSSVNLDAALNKMNNSLRQISQYLKNNKLKLNIAKTKAMIITTQYKYKNININTINLSIDNNNIELVTNVKYLGFVIDNHLQFNAHFDYIQKKITKKLYFFSRISQKLSDSTKITVFSTIIQPHFDYCASVLYSFDLNKITALQKLQNRGMRVILRCNRYTPIQHMLTSLQWLCVKDRLFYLSMVFIFKILNNLLPDYFKKYIILANEVHQYNTRYNCNYYIPRRNLSQTMKILLCKGLDQYNKLPNNVKESVSLTGFKRAIVSYIKSLG